jgi:hypothetical protein
LSIGNRDEYQAALREVIRMQQLEALSLDVTPNSLTDGGRHILRRELPKHLPRCIIIDGR